MAVFAVNKRAKFDYDILDEYEAGISLLGHEVKSVRQGHIHLKSAYVTVKNNEVFLMKCHISPYKKAGNLDNYDPDRSRKLLLHKRQIKGLIGKLEQKGLTLIPLKVYTANNRIKVKFAVAKGKKKYDKRQAIKERDVSKKIKRTLKQY